MNIIFENKGLELLVEQEESSGLFFVTYAGSCSQAMRYDESIVQIGEVIFEHAEKNGVVIAPIFYDQGGELIDRQGLDIDIDDIDKLKTHP